MLIFHAVLLLWSKPEQTIELCMLNDTQLVKVCLTRHDETHKWQPCDFILSRDGSTQSLRTFLNHRSSTSLVGQEEHSHLNKTEQNFSSWLFVNLLYFSVSISTPLTAVYSFSCSISPRTHWWFWAIIESPSQLIKQVWSTSSALFMMVPLICLRLVRLRVPAVRGLQAIAFFLSKGKII